MKQILDSVISFCRSHKNMMSEDRILCALFLLVSFCFNPTSVVFSNISNAVIIFSISEIIIKRLLAFYLDDIYNKRGLLNHVLDCHALTYIIIIICPTIFGFNPHGNIFSLLSGYYLLKAINFDNSAYKRTQNMLNADGLDYGSGMAYSYFHGFLSIILPDRGDKNNGLKLNIINFENKENIEFIRKKLYILVPSTLYCPPNLEDVSGQNGGPKLEASKNLESEVRNRAGVQNRHYSTSVYKIHRHDNSRPLYLLAEGATPLLTLHESLHTTSTHSDFYIKHKADILRMFCKTLTYLLETDMGCKDLCEVVYYNNDNNDTNVAQVLLDHILGNEPDAE